MKTLFLLIYCYGDAESLQSSMVTGHLLQRHSLPLAVRHSAKHGAPDDTAAFIQHTDVAQQLINFGVWFRHKIHSF